MIVVGVIENIKDSPEIVANLLASMGKKSLNFIDDKTIYWFDMLYYIEAKNDQEKKAVIKTTREYVNEYLFHFHNEYPNSLCKNSSLTNIKFCNKHNPQYAFCKRDNIPQLNHKPIERFAINFGRWESETAKDKKAVDCHAHFHLHLNKEVVLCNGTKEE
ncbi:hypothetical protein GLOIN_2v1783898 [Rhizophagus clarus]|uniref:Uncharacterized protein n=1 Tax=Rhizophagus clarus TaxID=94130 RepID=A0A8H3R5E1_9GLOM|nr:hypothetical protein GLOIN_2v1783898 [Rhizophagus clarus]